MGTFGRIRVWFACLLLSVSLFSLFTSSSNFFCLLFVSPMSAFGMISSPANLLNLVSRIAGSSFFIFCATMIFAFPVWCLCLPIIWMIKYPEGWQLWATVLTGTLIGPVALAFWGLALQLRGVNTRIIWQGDGLGPGVEQGMAYALMVGLLASACYVMALKSVYRRTAR